MSRRGFLISFSGLESSGKSTQIDTLVAELRRCGERPLCLWTRPGYTKRLEAAKRAVRRLKGAARPARPNAIGQQGARVPRYPRRASDFRRTWKRRLWLRLALIDLLATYVLQARLWRLRGRTVVFDRYLTDGVVDFRVNFPDEAVEAMWLAKLLRAAAPRPDAAFLLDVPVEESIRRSDARRRGHRETREVLERRRAAYAQLAEGGNWTVIDGRASQDEIARIVAERIPGARIPS